MKYLLLSDAEAYFAARINSDPWDLAEDVLKEKALNHAERNLERLPYKGLEITAGYIFPRDEQTAVPVRVMDAVCEEALALLNGVMNEEELANLHVSSASAAGFNTSVNELQERPWIEMGLASPIAWNLIAPYILDSYSFRTATA